MRPSASYLEPHRAHLTRLREDASDWDGLACSPVSGPDGEWEDGHELTRYGVLLCLQYDRRAEDQPLVRYAFEQEIHARREDPFQGLTPALELGAFLLARFRDPSDLPLFVQAKLANFDTCCGLDMQYLYLFGKEALDAHQGCLERKEAREVLELLEEHGAVPNPEDLPRWWAEKERAHPEREADEDPLVLAQRALEFGALDEGRTWLDVWERQAERTESTLFTLVHLRRELQQPDLVLAAARERVGLHRDRPMQYASALLDTVQPLVTLGRLPEAYDTLAELAAILRREPGIREVGLGRSIVERMLDTLLADSCPPETGRHLWSQSEELWGLGIRPSLNALEKCSLAAARFGLPEDLARYTRLIAAESARIDRELQRARRGE